MNNLQHKFNRGCVVTLYAVAPLGAILFLSDAQEVGYGIGVFLIAILIAIANEIHIARRHEDRSQYL